MTYLAEPFAREGAAAVPLLKEKLEQADDDLTVRDIALVFAEMSRLETYDVAGDAELLRLLEQRIHGMADPDWRQMAERSLSQIHP